MGDELTCMACRVQVANPELSDPRENAASDS